MILLKGSQTIRIPNPHGADIDWSLTKQIIEQAGISKDEWEAAK